jgi:hypothetical protein
LTESWHLGCLDPQQKTYAKLGKQKGAALVSPKPLFAERIPLAVGHRNTLEQKSSKLIDIGNRLT